MDYRSTYFKRHFTHIRAGERVKCSNYVLNIKLDVMWMVETSEIGSTWMNWCFEGEVNDLM